MVGIGVGTVADADVNIGVTPGEDDTNNVTTPGVDDGVDTTLASAQPTAPVIIPGIGSATDLIGLPVYSRDGHLLGIVMTVAPGPSANYDLLLQLNAAQGFALPSATLRVQEINMRQGAIRTNMTLGAFREHLV